MQIGQYTCDANEAALINKYNFKVRDDNGQFVVTDPSHKKLGKMSGGNLYLLLTDMEKARLKLDAFLADRAANGKAKATVTTTPKPAVEAATAPKTESPVQVQPETVSPTTEAPETVSGPSATLDGIIASKITQEPWHGVKFGGENTPDTITGVVLDDSGGKVKKPKKAKSTPRDPSKLKFLSAFKLWLLYPDKEPPFVRDKLIAQGIDAKDSSVEMLRHMCSNVVRAMVELGFVTKESIKEHRATILADLKLGEEVWQKAKEEKDGNSTVC